MFHRTFTTLVFVWLINIHLSCGNVQAASSVQEELSGGDDEDTFSINELPGYVEPSMQDLLLLDVKHETLMEIGENLEIEYLNQTDETPTFPVTGLLFMPNNRIMVNLVCSRQKRRGFHGVPLNVVFLVDTGSPMTYISHQAMRALINAPDANLPKSMMVNIHGTVTQGHLSPKDKRFADVNVLGMDYLVSRQLSMKMNYNDKVAVLVPSEMLDQHCTSS
jgi:hypothetical protein